MTLCSLFIGYVGIYFSWFALATIGPLLIADLHITDAQIGTILIISRLARAAPKLLSGGFVDLLNSKIMFIVGGYITSFSLLMFAIPLFGSPFWWLTTWFTLMNLATTPAWQAVVAMVNRWSHSHQVGRTMAVMSLAYLFGDVATRWYMSFWISLGFGWRAIMCISSFTVLVFMLVCTFAVRATPLDIGRPEPAKYEQMHAAELLRLELSQSQQGPVQGESLEEIVAEEEEELPMGVMLRMGPVQFFLRRVVPLFANLSFWVLAACFLSLSILRFVLLDWFELYLLETYVSKTRGGTQFAASVSVMFSFFGGFAILFMGFIHDKISRVKRTAVMVALEVLAVVFFLSLCMYNTFVPLDIVTIPISYYMFTIPAIIAYAALGFVVMGPYSLPAAALSIEQGGQMAATVSGFLDGIGAIGSSVSGLMGAWILERDPERRRMGWTRLFAIMAAVAASAVFFSVVYLVLEVRKQRRIKAASSAAAVPTQISSS